MSNAYARIDFDPSENVEENSRELYEVMASDILSTPHGSRFEIRPFTIDPTNGYDSPLTIDRPYCEPIWTPDEQKLWIAKTATSLVMRDQDHDALLEGMTRIYERSDVKAHLDGGGSIKWVDSHHTYVGQVVQKIISWQALHSLGIEDPVERQMTIASRIVSLFRLSFLPLFYEAEGIDHYGGMIMEDVLLRFGGVVLTIPNSASGKRMIETMKNGLPIRKEAIAKTTSAYEQRLNQGAQIIFEGSSATENKKSPSGTHLIIGGVKERTAQLTTDYNQTAGAERVMTIPIFMECAPFTGNSKSPIEPVATPFAIMEPRFPKDRRDFDDMMREIAAAGTLFKRAGSLPYRYEKRFFGKPKVPDIFYSHAA